MSFLKQMKKTFLNNQIKIKLHKMNIVKIKLEGFGGELNIGKIDSTSAKSLMKKAEGNYGKIVRNDDEMSELGLPIYSQINDILSLNCITKSDCLISITDDQGNSIFNGDYGDLDTDYCGDYNQENIIAVSKNPDEHDFATVVIDEPVLYSFSAEKGIFFVANIELPVEEKFDLNQLALVTNEVKINTDDDTVFGYDFIIEVRYQDNLLNNLASDTEPVNFNAEIVEP